MQLQFTLAIIHCSHSVYIDCDFPKWMHYTLIGYAISFIILFTNFYIHTYIMRGGQKKMKNQNGSVVANGVSGTGSGMEQKQNSVFTSSGGQEKKHN